MTELMEDILKDDISALISKIKVMLNSNHSNVLDRRGVKDARDSRRHA
jgi:hypothetical protein